MVRSAALLIAPLKRRAANTALGHHRDLPSVHSKGRFGVLKVSVFRVGKCFFFPLAQPTTYSLLLRFLVHGSILKGSVKFGLTKHFSNQSSHRRFSWPHCYGVNCTALPLKGFPGGASGTEPACQCRRPKRGGFNPWVGKIPWRRAWHPLQCSCLENPHGQRSLAGYSPWGPTESDMTESTQHGTPLANPYVEVLPLRTAQYLQM